MNRDRHCSRTPTLLRALLLAAWACVWVGTPAAAEEKPPAVRESGPEIYYMQDDAGRLVPVPGFRYRDFVDLLRIREGLPGLPEAPPAVLENIVVRGDLTAVAGPGAATCPVTVELAVRQVRGGWVSVPVALDGLLLTAAPRYEGPGRMLLTPASATDAAPRQGGYRIWLTGPADKADEDVRHAVTLSGEVAIDVSPTQESVALQLPRATASLVELKTARPDPIVTVQPASLPPRISPRPAGDGSTVALAGLSGAVQVQLSARRTAEAGGAVATGAVPQSLVESVVRIDGRVAVTEAGLRLDNLPADTNTIRVALPPRTAVRNVRGPALLVAVAGPPAEPVAEIRIERGPDGRSLVELECERPVDPTGREAFEPLGFAVEGIPLWRQWGRTSIVAEGDWQVDWDNVGANRRIDPPLSVRRPGFVAAFAYDAQPARLPLRVRPRGSRVVIEPEYRYDVAASRVSLDARLRVAVRGAPVSRIVVALGTWDVDEVGPASIVDTAAVTTEEGRLVIPFVQPLSGDAVVEVRCGRSLPAGADRVSWQIPTPQADLVGPASVIIAAASDIELLPDASGVRGLVRQLTPATLRSDADRVALAYRLDGTDGSFEATRRFLPRRVDASVSVQADIDASDTIVRETIRFDVAHVPLEFVTLTVPEGVMRTGTLEVRQNGQLLNPANEASVDGNGAGQQSAVETPSEVNATGPTAVPAAAARLRAMLAVPLLGTGEVTIQYELPTPTVPAEATVAEDLPLVLPAAARLGRQSVALTVPETLSIDVRGDAWKRDVTASGAVAGRTWTTARVQEYVPLALSARQRAPLGETVVEASWLQTRLLGDRREDVFSYAITSSADQLSLTLPPDLAGAADTAGSGNPAVEVRLDGQVLPAAAAPDGRVVIELPRHAGSRTWLVEIISSRSRERRAAAWGGVAMPAHAVVLAPAMFPPGTLQRRFYWELLLEPDEHAIGSPARWTSQQRWEWGAIGLRRMPVVSREVLAAWLAASAAGSAQSPPQARLPADVPAVGSRIVFAGVGTPGEGRIWVVPTWLLVLAVSGPVLAIGLLLVYRWAAKLVPAGLAVAAVASIAAAAFPELAALVAQAAVPGIALTLLAAALRTALEPRTPRLPPAIAASSSLTRAASLPSLIIASSSPRLHESGPAAGHQPP